jgi:hypothetical protein
MWKKENNVEKRKIKWKKKEKNLLWWWKKKK